MWRNLKFCQNLRNFKCLHMTDVKKCEIYPVFCCKIGFVTIYPVFCKIRDVAIYAPLRGEKLSPKLYGWRKNDKYEVCAQSVFNIQKKRTKLPELGGWGRGNVRGEKNNIFLKEVFPLLWGQWLIVAGVVIQLHHHPKVVTVKQSSSPLTLLTINWHNCTTVRGMIIAKSCWFKFEPPSSYPFFNHFTLISHFHIQPNSVWLRIWMILQKLSLHPPKQECGVI